LIAVGTATQPVVLSGVISFRGTNTSEIAYAAVRGGIFTEGSHVVNIRNTLFERQSNLFVRSPGSTVTRTVFQSPQSDNGVFVGAPDVTFSDVVIRNAPARAMTIEAQRVSVRNCEIHNNGFGFLVVNAADVSITDCNIYNNAGPGVMTQLATATATNNWWGDPAGPLGPAGDGVTGNVTYIPFRTTRVPLDTAAIYR
jgi:hypothetical protein